MEEGNKFLSFLPTICLPTCVHLKWFNNKKKKIGRRVGNIPFYRNLMAVNMLGLIFKILGMREAQMSM